MVRQVAFVVGVVTICAAAGGFGGKAWAAGSKCNAAVTKAVGKKVACREGVYATAQKKGQAADATKLAKCDSSFSNTCTKAVAKGGCDPGHSNCTAKEAAADTASNSLSPSGAFLDVSPGLF